MKWAWEFKPKYPQACSFKTQSSWVLLLQNSKQTKSRALIWYRRSYSITSTLQFERKSWPQWSTMSMFSKVSPKLDCNHQPRTLKHGSFARVAPNSHQDSLKASRRFRYMSSNPDRDHWLKKCFSQIEVLGERKHPSLPEQYMDFEQKSQLETKWFTFCIMSEEQRKLPRLFRWIWKMLIVVSAQENSFNSWSQKIPRLHGYRNWAI